MFVLVGEWKSIIRYASQPRRRRQRRRRDKQKEARCARLVCAEFVRKHNVWKWSEFLRPLLPSILPPTTTRSIFEGGHRRRRGGCRRRPPRPRVWYVCFWGMGVFLEWEWGAWSTMRFGGDFDNGWETGFYSMQQFTKDRVRVMC